MGRPVDSELTGHEAEQASAKETDGRTDREVWLAFAGLAACIAVAGYAIGETSIAIVELTPLFETAVGGVFTAIANSLPELVTAIAAVRIGAVNLAVGDVIGGNAFEVLFLAAADLTYTEGSLYARFDDAQVFSLATVILMVAVLLLGMLRRQRHGPGGIGWESVTVLGLYALSVLWQLSV